LPLLNHQRSNGVSYYFMFYYFMHYFVNQFG
jgi:hypothetical protein